MCVSVCISNSSVRLTVTISLLTDKKKARELMRLTCIATTVLGFQKVNLRHSSISTLAVITHQIEHFGAALFKVDNG